MEIERVYREVAPKHKSYLTGNGCLYRLCLALCVRQQAYRLTEKGYAAVA